MPKEDSSVSVPRLAPACDVRRLPLTPTEGYLLSRIDGHVSTIELCLMTGLGRDDVEKALEHLAELGAVTMGSEPEPTERVPERSEIAAQAMQGLKGPIIETYRPSPPDEAAPASGALYDPAELDEEVDVPQEKRRQVLDLFYKLEDLNFYELLGVEREAEKKEIKDAYFRMASEYHPDRYFRKNLGSYKTKIEAIFGKITLAHDTLTRKNTRADYDSYIETVSASRKLEATIKLPEPRKAESRPKQQAQAVAPSQPAPARQPSPPPVSASAQRTSPPPPADPPPQANRPAPAAATRLGSVIPGRMGESGRPPQPVIREASAPSEPGAKPTSSSPPRMSENDRLRRELLARRLGAGVRGSVAPAPGGAAPAVRPSAAPLARPAAAAPAARPMTSSPPSSMTPESAAADLRRRFEERQVALRRAQLKEYGRQAEEASVRGDAASAARAYRAALELSPDDEQLKQALAEAEKKAVHVLADMYLRQAAYEEKEGNWKEAARSYGRVAEALTDDAPVQERAANALLKSDGDLHLAAQYARRAVELNDKKPEYRTTLAKVYLAAGLKLNARRELEIASELAPGDANISRLLKSLR